MTLIVAPTPVADTATPASHFDDDAIAGSRAEDYVVNGHAASPAEAQLLMPYSAAPPAGRSTASAFQQHGRQTTSGRGGTQSREGRDLHGGHQPGLLMIDGKFRAWIEARRDKSGVIAAFIAIPAGSSIPIPRLPATRLCASRDAARQWVEGKARAVGGVAIEWECESR